MSSTQPPSDNPHREHRIIVACMPKSGSTFLTELLARMPGMRHAYLVPGYGRREQELCLQSLEAELAKTEVLRRMSREGGLPGNSWPRGFVAQMHLRYSGPTARILRDHGLFPIVLVRNLFDVVVSMKDHLCKRPVKIPMAYFSERMRDWPEERIYAFIADMVIPWYFNFFVNWSDAGKVKRVTFETLIDDPRQTLEDIASHVGMACSNESLDTAVRQARARTSLNVGVVGRGRQLPESIKERIRRFAAYYDNHDLSSLGL